MAAVSVTNWLRGASSGIDVDTDVVVLTDLNVIGSAPISLQGMEVDDADYHRRADGETYRVGRSVRLGSGAAETAGGVARGTDRASGVGSVYSDAEAGTVVEGDSE